MPAARPMRCWTGPRCSPARARAETGASRWARPSTASPTPTAASTASTANTSRSGRGRPTARGASSRTGERPRLLRGNSAPPDRPRPANAADGAAIRLHWLSSEARVRNTSRSMLQQLGIAFGAWTIVAAVAYARIPLQALAQGRTLPPMRGAFEHLVSCWIWALFTPAILWLVRRYPLDRGTWAKNGAVHLAAAAATVLIGAPPSYAITALLDVPGHAPDLTTQIFAESFIDVFSYAALVVLGHALAYYRESAEQRLRARIGAGPGGRVAFVPRLVLQPLVENALRHGIEPSSDPGRIEVRASRSGDMLELEVRDSGAGGGSSQPSTRTGLANTRARLEQLYGDRHELILSSDGKGTVARVG